jgi:hypothetical protein
MQIAYSEHTLDAVMEIFAVGFKVADGDKVIKREHFIDPIKGTVIFRHTIQRKGEDEPAPLIVLPDAKN